MRSNRDLLIRGNHKLYVSLLLGLTASCLVLGGLPVSAAGSIAEADQLLLEDKYKQAEDSYRGLLESDQTGDVSAGLAVALAKQAWPAKVQEAERILKDARDKYSDNPNVLAAGGYVSFIHSRGVASPAKKDLYLEAAESLCKRAIKANSEIVIAQQTLGLVKMAQDELDEAIEPLRKAAKIAENPVNLTFLAQALFRQNPKNDESDGLVDRALAIKPDFYPAHLQKAALLLQHAKAEEAYSELHNIPENGRTPDWYLVEGDVLRKQGDGPAALAAWRESVRLDARSPEPYKRLAEYHTLRGDGEMAIGEMHDALEILPNDMLLRTKLAELALRQDKLDVAEAEYRTILDAQAGDPQALLGLSRVYFRKARKDGQYPPDWQKLMDQLNNVVTEQSVKGQVLKADAKNLQENIELSEAEKALTQKRFRDARQHFSAVINNHRDSAYDLLTLGEQAFNDGDLSAAEQAFTYAKEIPEVASRGEQGLSKISSQKSEADRQTKLGDATWKQPEVAEDHYKQALIADPQSANAYYGLYSIYAKSSKSDPDRALNYASAFLEAAEDSNPLRQEVESYIVKLKKQIGKPKRK
jgi:cytochrome c-type biogenesis protein CcmH/NrfG